MFVQLIKYCIYLPKQVSFIDPQSTMYFFGLVAALLGQIFHFCPRRCAPRAKNTYLASSCSSSAKKYIVDLGSIKLTFSGGRCPGVSVWCLCVMKECVFVASSVRGQALRPSPWDAPPCGAERRLLARALRRLLNNGRVSREIPRSCQRIPQHLPISWAKTCPLRKILTNHRCIKSCRSMSRHGVTQNGKVFGTKTFQA
jgi:hypothetical protein